MGKGDKRTKRGKICNGSYGKKRPKHAKKIANEPKKEHTPTETTSDA